MSNKKTPWVEKYRPVHLDQVIGQDDITTVLKSIIATGEMTHLLLHGPPGTGKTSAVLATAYQLFGPVRVRERMLELNASDERGIDTVRTTIIQFAKLGLSSVDPEYPSPKFKIVVLDEADAMTPEAQSALKKIMETKSNITRFCFICNYVQHIIEPIASRCMKFRFKPISSDKMHACLTDIAEQEGIDISSKVISQIVSESGGDMRQAVTILQNTKYMLKYKTVSSSDIRDITGDMSDDYIANLWDMCLTGSFDDVVNASNHVTKMGYNVSKLLVHLKKMTDDAALSDISKAKICMKLCECDGNLLSLGSENMQTLGVLVYIREICQSDK